MAWRPRNLGLLLLIYAAALGYALIAWTPQLVDVYDRVAARQPSLAYAYLAAVVTGGVLLAGASIVLFVKVWRNTAAKNKRRRRRATDPSGLSPAERRAELEQNLAGSQQLADDEHASAELRKQLRAQLDSLQEKQ